MAGKKLVSFELETLIVTVRGQRVILSPDLARVYGVQAKVLNQAVKRNKGKFPADFMFQLTQEEVQTAQRSRSQFVTLKRGQNIKYPPYAFTEHGAIMAANVLNSPRAEQMSVFVVRAFVRMRSMLSDNRELARQLVELEKRLTQRLDSHETAIVEVLRRVMRLLKPPPEPLPPAKPPIGFQVKEGKCRYKAVRRGNHRKA
ncbi:MAG: ORF6N domain-containing protein [Elusimicrobia bacterium]|nr:ORF6N domain-containing protein [Elusimicrobiota bacterium]